MLNFLGPEDDQDQFSQLTQKSAPTPHPNTAVRAAARVPARFNATSVINSGHSAQANVILAHMSKEVNLQRQLELTTTTTS